MTLGLLEGERDKGKKREGKRKWGRKGKKERIVKKQAEKTNKLTIFL